MAFWKLVSNRSDGNNDGIFLIVRFPAGSNHRIMRVIGDPALNTVGMGQALLEPGNDFLRMRH